MKLVLLSGGSGKRLWPLSNDLRSKQFLKVLSGPGGQPESMVQRVWSQMERANLAEHACVATGKDQADMIRAQIGPHVPIIVEPERRDTFAAIALAAAYLYSRERIGLKEVVTILPVDPYVDDPFFHKIRQLESVLHESGADLALIGVKPTHAAEKYGYIVPDPAAPPQERYRKVSHFVEKPPADQASELLKRQALWNCGVFAFRLEFLIDRMLHRDLPIQYDELIKHYPLLPKISFDYEIVEKTRNVVAATYDGYWKDLGTWNTLTEEIRIPVIGKGMLSEDSSNTHIINELEIPVAVLGISNVVVSASPDGILVADKSASPRVKDLIHDVDQRPMYEECRWGSNRVLDYRKYPEGGEVLTKRIVIEAGQNLSYHFHEHRKEVWTILSGEGDIVLDGRISRVTAGDVVSIPAGSKHSIRALREMELIEVQTGSELSDDDVIRLSLSWEEIVQYPYKMTNPL